MNILWAMHTLRCSLCTRRFGSWLYLCLQTISHHYCYGWDRTRYLSRTRPVLHSVYDSRAVIRSPEVLGAMCSVGSDVSVCSVLLSASSHSLLLCWLHCPGVRRYMFCRCTQTRLIRSGNSEQNYMLSVIKNILSAAYVMCGK